MLAEFLASEGFAVETAADGGDALARLSAHGFASTRGADAAPLEEEGAPLKAIDYAAPGSVAEAANLLSERGERARVLAGGTDIIVQVREGRRDLDLLVDVKNIPELTELSFDPKQGLKIGAAVPFCRIYEDAKIAKRKLKGKVVLFWDTYNSRKIDLEGVNYQELPTALHGYFKALRATPAAAKR